MRTSYFFLPITILTTIISRITAIPTIDTIEKLQNDVVKRQSSPICSSVCGTPDVQSCMNVPATSSEVCKTETLPAPMGGDCSYTYFAASDGTCIASEDLAFLVNALSNTCLLGHTKNGGCVNGPNGDRLCVFSNKSPCH